MKRVLLTTCKFGFDRFAIFHRCSSFLITTPKRFLSSNLHKTNRTRIPMEESTTLTKTDHNAILSPEEISSTFESSPSETVDEIADNLLSASSLTSLASRLEIRRNSFLFENFLRYSQEDLQTANMFLPTFQTLWQRFRDNHEFEQWPIDIASVILLRLGKLNRKFDSSLRRIINRSDIRIFETNFVNHKSTLTARIVSSSCSGLKDLQLWTEMETNDYPSNDYIRLIKCWLNDTMHSKHIVSELFMFPLLLLNVGKVVQCFSNMSTKPNGDVVRFLTTFLPKCQTLLDEMNWDANPSQFVEQNLSIDERRHLVGSILTQCSNGLFGCSQAMMNWKMYANVHTNRILWNSWFVLCDTLLKQTLRELVDDREFLLLNRPIQKSLYRLIYAAIVSANYYNNMEEFWQMRRYVDHCLIQLIPTIDSSKSAVLLLQIKCLSNKMMETKSNLATLDLFSSELIHLLRKQCDDNGLSASSDLEE